jgi:hypothetical protein
LIGAPDSDVPLVREFAGIVDPGEHWGFGLAYRAGKPRRRHSEGTMKSRQSGITLIGFLVILAVVGFLGYMAMRLAPSYSEYMGVEKAMTQISTAGVDGKSLDDLRRELMFKMNFQYVDDATIAPADITLVRDKEGGATQLRVAYDKVVPFMYNIDFLLHFDKSVPLQGNPNQ